MLHIHGSGSPPFGIYGILTCFSYGSKSLRLQISMIFPGYFQDISRIFTWFWQPPFLGFQDIYMFFVRFKKPSTSNFHDISRIFPWFWQPPFWDLQDIYMFFVRFRKSSTSNFHDVSRISPGYLHGCGSPPFGIYRIFTCFLYGLESLRLRISMMFPGYLRDIYMVVAAPLLGFTGYLHVFYTVQKAFDFEFP